MQSNGLHFVVPYKKNELYNDFCSTSTLIIGNHLNDDNTISNLMLNEYDDSLPNFFF
jgi:hypothetical protein